MSHELTVPLLGRRVLLTGAGPLVFLAAAWLGVRFLAAAAGRCPIE